MLYNIWHFSRVLSKIWALIVLLNSNVLNCTGVTWSQLSIQILIDKSFSCMSHTVLNSYFLLSWISSPSSTTRYPCSRTASSIAVSTKPHFAIRWSWHPASSKPRCTLFLVQHVYSSLRFTSSSRRPSLYSLAFFRILCRSLLPFQLNLITSHFTWSDKRTCTQNKITFDSTPGNVRKLRSHRQLPTASDSSNLYSFEHPDTTR